MATLVNYFGINLSAEPFQGSHFLLHCNIAQIISKPDRKGCDILSRMVRLVALNHSESGPE